MAEKQRAEDAGFGRFLRDLRDARGMSLRDVETATEGKISNGYLSQLETGSVRRPSAVMLHRLATAYEVEYGALMERAGLEAERAPSRSRQATSIFGELTREEEA